MGVAENIAALLAKFQISQNGFASSIQVSAPTVSRWRSGSMRMRHSTLERICETYDLVPDDILSDSRGLAAQMFGSHVCSPTVPLVDNKGIDTFARQRSTQPHDRIETISGLLDRHPHAFAFTLRSDAAELGIPANAHVIIDPAVSPHDGSIVVVDVHKHPGAELRRFSPNSSDVPIPDIVGTVVWFQAPGLLD